MNDNQEKRKRSTTPWLLGAGALGLGSIGLALASKGKAKNSSVAKQVKKATTVDVLKPQTQAKLGAAKPQSSIKDELDQLRNQGQGQAKSKQVNMQDELDRMRNEAPKPQAKPSNMDDELGKIRSQQLKPQPKINYRSKNIDPKFDGKKTYRSGVSGYGGLSSQERRAKLDKRRRALADEVDREINTRQNRTKDNQWRTSDSNLQYNERKKKYDRNPLGSIIGKNNPSYLGTEADRVTRNKNLKSDNKRKFLSAVETAKKRGTEYSANIYLLCDL